MATVNAPKSKNPQAFFVADPVLAELERARQADAKEYDELLDIADRFGGEGIGKWLERAVPVLGPALIDRMSRPAASSVPSASCSTDVRAVEESSDETAAAEEADSDDWPPPTPLDESGDLPTFPVACLPQWLMDYVQAVAIATQVPVDLPAMVGLAVLSLAAAKKYRAVVRPGWHEPLNIYSLTVLAPGNRKSAVFAELTAPVVEWEKEALERQLPKIAAAKARKEVATAKAQRARAGAVKGKRVAGDEDDVELSVAAELLKVPEPLRLWVDDVTPEALASIQAGQHGRLAVLSAEGGLFGLLAGRYSSTGAPNFEVALKGHAGDALRVDRKGRPAEVINNPALTIGLTVQPDVISGLLRVPSFRGRGLLGRFLYSLPRSLVGRREVNPPTVPDELRSEYARVVHKLLDLPCTYRGEEIVASDLSVDPEAHERIVEFMRELEPTLGPGAELADVADWAAKLSGAVVRIAGLLHIADAGTSAEAVPLSIGRSTIERAIRVGEYLVPHAISAYSRMGQDPIQEDGQAIIEWLRRTQRSEVTKREIHQSMRARFRKAADLDPALALLVDHGYLRVQEADPTSGPGRKPSQAYDVHPDLRSPTQNPQNTQNCAGGESEDCEDEVEEGE